MAVDFDFCEVCGSEKVESIKQEGVRAITWKSKCNTCNEVVVIASQTRRINIEVVEDLQ